MVKNCPYDSFYKSLNRFLCLNTHSTFVKPWLLQFFLCVWKILHLYSFCSVYCGCYLYPVSILLCNAGVKSHKLYSSGSFARFHQWTTLAGDVEEGEKPSLTHFFFFFSSFFGWWLWRRLCLCHYPSSLSDILLHCSCSLGGSWCPGGAHLPWWV